MEKNIFEVGSEVSGESMIGYKYHLNYLIDTIKNTSINLSVTGLKRSGKTSLVKEAIRRIEDETDKLVFIKIDLARYKTFEEFLVKIYKETKRQIKKRSELQNNDDIIELIEELGKLKANDLMFREGINDLFFEICEHDDKYKIVLMIDEFDEAANIFENTSDYELLRSWASDGDMRFSLILISRRQVYMIEKRNFNNSTFHGIINSYPIKGFNEDDLNDYIDVLKKYGIKLTDFQKNRIRYYAGKSPFVWSMFGYCIVESKLNDINAKIDIDNIFVSNKAVDLNDHFKAVFYNLVTDKLSEGVYQDMSSVDKLCAIIFGPKLGVTHDDIRILKILGYLDDYNGEYYSVSAYFTEYLRNKHSVIKNSIFEGIINVEKKLKTILNINLCSLVDEYQIEGDSINDIQKSILLNTPGIDESAIRRYDAFINNNKCAFKQESTYFDVMSLKDSSKIIWNCWRSVFSKYFNNEEYEKWRDIFEQTGNARNPVAHGHEDFLSEYDKKILDVYCKKINDQLSDRLINSFKTEIMNDDDLIDYSKKYADCARETDANFNVSIEENRMYFVGETSGINKNLKGKLESGDAGSIKAKFFQDIGHKPYEFYGKKIPVKILSQNPQGNGYILEPAVSLITLL